LDEVADAPADTGHEKFPGSSAPFVRGLPIELGSEMINAMRRSIDCLRDGAGDYESITSHFALQQNWQNGPC
jgi:hypothetical protein